MLTIASLTGGESEGSTAKYTGQGQHACTFPVSLVRQHDVTKELSITAETIQQYGGAFGPTPWHYITFRFQPDHQPKFDQTGTIRILRSNVENALKKAKTSEDGRLFVHIEEVLHKFPNSPLGMLALFGIGRGTYNLFLVFNQDFSLSSIRINEAYQGERVLFEATNLKPFVDMSHTHEVDQQAKAEEERQDKIRMGFANL